MVDAMMAEAMTEETIAETMMRIGPDATAVMVAAEAMTAVTTARLFTSCSFLWTGLSSHPLRYQYK